MMKSLAGGLQPSLVAGRRCVVASTSQRPLKCASSSSSGGEVIERPKLRPDEAVAEASGKGGKDGGEIRFGGEPGVKPGGDKSKPPRHMPRRPMLDAP